MFDELPTPSIVISGPTVRRNIQRMAAYTRERGLALRPHTKTHKSSFIGRMQIEHGAVGLTVAKVGEARIMARATDDLLMAYPAVHPARCAELAELAHGRTVRVGLDSTTAADALSAAARSADTTLGILVEVDVGHHRTGVQNSEEARALAQYISKLGGLRLDGIMFYPGHLSKTLVEHEAQLHSVDDLIAAVIDAWKRDGLEAKIVSGGSTPTALNTHYARHVTEIRPGTYVFQDYSSIRSGCAVLEDVAARIVTTVISTAVPGQIVLDAGSKTLTNDLCSPAPESGRGMVVGYPQAVITKLSEEHAQVDISKCEKPPRVGDRVMVVPNHICPCINLQDAVWWFEDGYEKPGRALEVEARGKVF